MAKTGEPTRKIKFKKDEIFRDHQGFLLTRLGFGNWEKPRNKYTFTAENYYDTWILKRDGLKRRPLTWVLQNYVAYNLHFAFIYVETRDCFRLVVIHNGSILVDAGFKYLFAAFYYFFRVFHKKPREENSIPVWVPFSSHKVRRALVARRGACIRPVESPVSVYSGPGGTTAGGGYCVTCPYYGGTADEPNKRKRGSFAPSGYFSPSWGPTPITHDKRR